MAKESDVAKSSQAVSSKGTEAYDSILYLLGIDIKRVVPMGNPGDVIDLSRFQLPQAVEYPIRTISSRR